MSSRFAGLPQALKPQASEDTTTPTNPDDNGATTPAASTKEEANMADQDQNAAVEAAKKEAHDAGFKAATDRISAVFASEETKGREASAVKMLTNAAMTGVNATAIIELLADMPKTETTALSDEEKKQAAEEGGRKEMQEQLAKTSNSNVQPAGGGSAPEATAESVWDKAHALVGQR